MANFIRKWLEIWRSWTVDRSNLKVDRSKLCPKSIYRNKSRSIEFSQNLLLQSAPEHPIRSQKAVLPLIFTAEHAGFVFLVVSSSRGTLKEGRWVIVHGFLALVFFYKAIAMPPCWESRVLHTHYKQDNGWKIKDGKLIIKQWRYAYILFLHILWSKTD